jgi:polysaccharide pyruvyl transferase WcaK-like protein
MQILVDPSGYNANNHGDTAMLFMALERLRAQLPDAGITVINSDADLLTTRFPGIRCCDPEDRTAFFSNFLPGRALRRTLPAGAVESLLGAERRILVQRPALWSRAITMRRNAAGLPGKAVGYSDVLLSADVLVITGAGMINDSFGDHAITVLEAIQIAVRNGARVYLFGQGIGPVKRPDLRAKVTETLPLATRIYLRESVASPRLLEDVGVDSAKVAVTGDDAIELVSRLKTDAPADALGVNLRLAYYSDLDRSQAETVGRALRETAAGLGAPMVPVPISRYSSSDDLLYIHRMVLGSEPSPAAVQRESVEDVIRSAGRCRVVVTGSYHAAVFALAQGRSAVCMTRSAYYDSKFQGLRKQFGNGCEVVSLEDARGTELLSDAIRLAWSRADEVRPSLLRAAQEQVQNSRKAYTVMAAEVMEPRKACHASLQ